MRHRLLFAYPYIGQKPISNLTMSGFYTRFFTCQVENTLSIDLILWSDFNKTVENFLDCLWKKLWKTLQAFCKSKFINLSNF